MILTLFTTFAAHGGIPAYNRMVCRAMSGSENVFSPMENLVLAVSDNSKDIAAVADDYPAINLEAFDGNRLKLVRRLLQAGLSRKIDLALIGHVHYAGLGVLLRWLQPSMRFGVMVHGVDVWSRLPLLRRAALRQADFVISVSEYTKSKVVEVNGVQPHRVYLLPNTIPWNANGIDGAATTPGSVLDSHPKGTRVLSVCRLSSLEKYKGVETVIRSLPSVIQQVPDLQYFVAGSGDDQARHQRVAEEERVADRVHFLGSLDEGNLRRFYDSCDLFILPSWGEGFGIVYLEAMKYAKPVIAARSGGAPEVVKDRETGLLVEYGNVEQIAAAIISLCSNPTLRKQLGEAGRLRFENNYTFEHFKHRLHKLILTELAVHPGSQNAGPQ